MSLNIPTFKNTTRRSIIYGLPFVVLEKQDWDLRPLFLELLVFSRIGRQVVSLFDETGEAILFTCNKATYRYTS